MASESSEYILGKSKDEIERLTTQHQWLKNNTKRLIIASVDLTKPHLRVLDSGCADGEPRTIDSFSNTLFQKKKKEKKKGVVSTSVFTAHHETQASG